MKRIDCIILLLICLLCMSGCEQESSQDATAAPTAAQTTVPATEAVAETTEPDEPQLPKPLNLTNRSCWNGRKAERCV